MPRQRHAGDRGAGGGRHRRIRAAGQRLSRVLRREDALMPVLHTGGGVRPAGRGTVPPAGAAAGAGVSHGPQRRDGAGCRYADRLHAADQRHGAADVSATELVRAGGHRADEAHGADVHIAELRRQSGRDADALRQSAEPIPI